MKLLASIFFLLPLSQAVTNTLTNNGVYASWLASANYRNSLFLPADSQETGVAVHWTISDDNTTLSLAVAVEASGWLGFGLSENGGMTGSDMMIFEAAKPDVLLDAYVTQERNPQIDDCQDWTLKGSTVKDGTIIVEASRKLDTGDPQDLTILNDSDPSFPVHRIISAWGDTESYGYHGMNRSRGTIRWFVGDLTEEERFENAMTAYANNTIKVLAENYPIKPIKTEYAYKCISGDGLRSQGVDLDSGVTMVGIEPYVTSKHVHHFTVYASFSENNDNTACNMTDYFLLTFIWAPGGPPFAFADFLGMPIGGETGYRSFRIEYHYDNPDLVEDAVDNSGIIYYYSLEPREQTMGVLQIGDPFVALYGTPIADGTTSYLFDCPSACSNSVLDSPVTVVRQLLHMHKSGVNSYSEQYRDGKMIRSSKAEYYDFDQQGAQAVLQEPFDIQPGDSFKVNCYYQNADGTNRVFGLGSDQEMCISYFFYYPAKITASGSSYVCGVGLSELLPDCNIALADVNVTNDASQELLADRVYGTPSEQCLADGGMEGSGAIKRLASALSILAAVVAAFV